MKKTIVLMLIIIAICIVSKVAVAISPVSIKVEQKVLDKKIDKEKSYYSYDRDKTEEIQLVILIKNVSGKALNDLNVKWFIYVKDFSSGEIHVIDECTETLSLKKLEQRRLYSNSFESSLRKHRYKSGMIHKEGKEYYGYAILINHNNDLVDYKCSKTSIKNTLIEEGLIPK